MARRVKKSMKKGYLTVPQAARFLGFPVEMLIRMRTDSTRRHDRRGPPYLKISNDDMTSCYVYHELSLIKWASTRSIFLTADDVAWLLGLDRLQVLRMFGLQSKKLPKGKLIIDSAKNFFIFVHKNKLKLMKGERL